jgi:multidrug efflux pump subunit AcrB
LESTWIVMQAPLALRANPQAMTDLPVPTRDGRTVPLGELGSFHKALEDPVIYHKDLRPLEYVVGDAVGRLGAPIYPMLVVDEKLANYTTPDGQTLSGTMTGPPENTGLSAFEWSGEWTVTYETFRDMGAAFAVALILIYMLVVGMFGNFLVPAIIMAPIPLTLLGIVPGHWVFNAQFTATSMIGFIALAGIIVRNSILLVDFAIEEVSRGMDVREAVIGSCKARTRPIMITAFALMGGASVILTDPIFQGMAISLLFGVFVSTVLTLVVIPLGAVSAAGSIKQIANGRSSEGQAPSAH